jgi:signal transduction histidine kinase
LKDIIAQCERLETLVRDTLDYSPEKRFEERTELTPRALLGRALWLAQTQFGPNHSRIQVVLDVPEELPAISVHPTRMERVLVNLILNAFQAMPPEGGHLLLKAQTQGNRHILRVQDDGKGFTEEEMARLFEPFYTSRKMGSGLGLAICQKIVGEHQGVIRAERVAPRGAAFTIEIPIPATAQKD